MYNKYDIPTCIRCGKVCIECKRNEEAARELKGLGDVEVTKKVAVTGDPVEVPKDITPAAESADALIAYLRAMDIIW